MPVSRILCWMWVLSRTVMVSPSATWTTLPSKGLGLHLQRQGQRNGGGRRFKSAREMSGGFQHRITDFNLRFS